MASMTTFQHSPIVDEMRHISAPESGGVYDLISYHLGWTEADGTPIEGASGKMVRPRLCMIAAAGYGDADTAIRAAAAMELLHAFSLAHDDIEDGDLERRHRPTLWAVYGVPLALNAGDGLFALGFKTMTSAVESLPQPTALKALNLYIRGALRMIEGQHWDIEFETRECVSVSEYEAMAVRKTGALLGTSLALGALVCGAGEEDVDLLVEIGEEAGLAFQAVDDALAIWGDPDLTGKAVGNDLQRGKKSLPVVLARALFPANGVAPTSLEMIAASTSIRLEISKYAARHGQRARDLLDRTTMSPEAKRELDDIIDFILQREI